MRFPCRSLLMAVLALIPLLASGCERVEEAFSGLIGRVMLGPVEGAIIEVYDGSQFTGFDSTEPIATGTSVEGGAFRIAIADQYIGRSLIVAARFPADDAGTPEDERAHYIDYSNPGANVGTQVFLEPADGPWVGMIDFFDGLDVPLAITPWTTAAFKALESAEGSQVGSGDNRYVTENVLYVQKSLGVNLGLGDDLASILPAQPTIGGAHGSEELATNDDSRDSVASLYSLIQLDRAARAFAIQTTRADDDVHTFLQALYIDAQDGALEGTRFGEPVRYFSEAGAPDVIGLNPAERSKLLAFLAGFTPTTQEQEAIEQSSEASPYLTLTEMQAAQGNATGVLELTRINDVSFRLVPNTGDAVLTIHGQGFLANAEVLITNNQSANATPSGTRITVDADSTGDDGELVSVSRDQIEVRLPDLSSRAGFTLVNGNEPRIISIFVRQLYGGPLRESDERFFSTGNYTLFAPTGLHVLRARIQRVNADGSFTPTTRQDNAEAAGTDPSALDPTSEGVYALVCEVFNGYPNGESLSNAQLEVALSEVTLNQMAIPHAAYGAGGTPLLTWPSDADRTTNSIALAAGQHATLATRFVLDAAQLNAATLAAFEDQLEIQPRIAATISSGGTINDMQAAELDRLTATAIPTRSEQNVLLSDAGAVGAASVASGQPWSLGWQINAFPVSGVNHRSFEITRVTVEINAAGTTLRSVLSADAVDDAGIDPLFGITNVRGSSSDGASGIPLSVVNSPVLIELDFLSRQGFSANVMITITADIRDPATGANASITTNAMVSVTP